MKLRQVLRKTVTLATLGCFAALPSVQARASDLQGEIDSMFTNLGAIGNYTQPGAFRGQAYNTYTGGSIFLRSPNKVYQLATIQFPYVKAGCGGIDVSPARSRTWPPPIQERAEEHHGQTARCGVPARALRGDPLLGQKAEWRNRLRRPSTTRASTGETATSRCAGRRATGFDAFSSCVRIAIELGPEPDEDAARNRCRTVRAPRSAPAPAAATQMPRQCCLRGQPDLAGPRRVTTLDDPERELLMSIVGTVIYYPADQNRDPDVVRQRSPASPNSIRAGDAGSARGRSPVRRDEWSACMNVRDDTTSTSPFTTKVEEIMTSISDKIANRTAVPTAQEIGFVNTVSEPVYRMLAIGNAVKGSGQADALIRKYREVIATDYAYNFLDQYFRVGMAALEKDFGLNTEQKGKARRCVTACKAICTPWR
jgi:conjugative transfer pilus assembly protein TraH